MNRDKALDAIEIASRDEIAALQTERQVQLIQDFKPKIIMVTPSCMLAIADEFDRHGHLDTMIVNVEIKPEFDTVTAAEKEFVAHDLQHHIKSYVVISTRVDIKAVSAIERLIGKAKRVIDTRPK